MTNDDLLAWLHKHHVLVYFGLGYVTLWHHPYELVNAPSLEEAIKVMEYQMSIQGALVSTKEPLLLKEGTTK